MKSVLLLTHDDEGQESRLQAALDVTRALGGHLSCLDVISPPDIAAYAGYGGYIETTIIDRERDRESANKARVKARLASEDVAWDWCDTVGFKAESVEAASALADLIVLSIRLSDDVPSDVRNLAGQVTRKARCPVLAVPASARGIDLSGPVVVAWDGSREAEEALREAVPLLALSSNVVLLGVGDPEGPYTPEDAARYLSRHDIQPTVETVTCTPGGLVWSTLLERAHGAGAGYLVMGAYGHSPVVETVFGGVTRSMLANSDLPLLLAH